MNKYQWKMASLAKGIDADSAIAEIERIESIFGSLTAENVLTASQSPDSLLHSLFQWDDTKAAHNYRLQQARTILNNIEINIISDGESKVMSVFEIVNLGEGRVYKSIQNMNPNDVEYVKQLVKREINHLKLKLSTYNKFEETIKHLDDAVNTL